MNWRPSRKDNTRNRLGRVTRSSLGGLRVGLGEDLQAIIQNQWGIGRQGIGDKCPACLSKGGDGKKVAGGSAFHGEKCNFRAQNCILDSELQFRARELNRMQFEKGLRSREADGK